MRQVPAAGFWMAAAFGVAFVLAALTLAVRGAGESGIFIALRATARWSFLLFWLAYAGGAMAALFGPTFQPVARRGREFGLAFAAAHCVHAGLVFWLYQISAEPPVPEASLVIFGIGLFWTYFLALFSIRRLSRALGPVIWRITRTIGVEYIAFAFLLDFAKNPFEKGVVNLVGYLPFIILAVVGPLLRLAVIVRRLASPKRIAL